MRMHDIIITVSTTTTRLSAPAQCIEQEEIFAEAVASLDCCPFDKVMDAFNAAEGKTPNRIQLGARLQARPLIYKNWTEKFGQCTDQIEFWNREHITCQP